MSFNKVVNIDIGELKNYETGAIINITEECGIEKKEHKVRD